MKESVTRRRLARAEKKVELLEQLVEDKTRELALHYRNEARVHAELDATMAAMPGALLRIDARGEIQLATPSVRRLLGWREPLVNQPAHLLSQRLWELAVGGSDAGSVSFEDAWGHSDGTAVPVLVHVARMDGGDLVCVGMDLRERRRLELELRHAQKLESIGRLASGIAHEINTPLQYICDNVAFVGEAWPDLVEVLEAYRGKAGRLSALEDERDLGFTLDNGARALDKALGGVDRVRRIVEAMRGVSNRREQGAPVDLDRLVEDARIIARVVTKRSARVRVELDGGVVFGSSAELGQVVINLLVNAAQAIDSAGRGIGEIVIRTGGDEHTAFVSVSDNGCGIDPEVLPRIFEPFFTTKDTGRGTGQGLALTHAIVARYGGRVEVQTELGVGTNFVVHLQRAGQEQAA